MRRIKAYSGPLLLSIFLLASTALHAQAPAAGTTVSVKMIDTVNSGSDPAGKQYRASVTKAITAANGVAVAQGAAATVTLTSSGSNYSAQLSSITINGQAVTVTSNSASVTATQSAAGSAATSAVNSVLGGFGRRVSAPASVAAAATGQHISLPTGTTLTFVLGASPAAPAAPAAQPAPAEQTASAEPAPAPASSPAATSGASVSDGITTLVVCYSDINSLYLSAAFEALADRYSDATLAFSNYLQATYHYSFGVKCLPLFTTADVGAAQKQLSGFAAKLKPIDTGWRLGQPAVAQGQSGFDPLAQGPGGIDLSQHRLATYFCTQGATITSDPIYPNHTNYVSQVFQADWDPAPVSMAYKVYIRDHYVHDLNPSANLSPSCNAQSPAMQTSMHQTAMISNKRTGKSVAVDFTDSPAEAAASNAAVVQAAAAATAAAAPTAAANQNYVWCNSAWGGTAGTMMPAGTVMYFSDVFAADMPPPPTPTPGHPLPPNANGAQINRINALQTSFFAFLQRKYGYKDSGNYPVDCRTGYPPTVAGLQNAEKYKQQFEDLAKQNRGQIVETAWKGQ